MDDEKKKVDTESTNQNSEKIENVENQKQTFSQQEVEEMVQLRLAKERKKYPSKEELDAYNTWKESQKTESEKNAEKEAEYQKAIKKNEDYERKFAVLNAGVKAGEDAEFVQYRVSQMDGDFNENLTNYLKNNPKYLASYQEPKETKPISLGIEHKTSTKQNELEEIEKVMGLKKEDK